MSALAELLGWIARVEFLTIGWEKTEEPLRTSPSEAPHPIPEELL
jgi:hypothetical protein